METPNSEPSAETDATEPSSAKAKPGEALGQNSQPGEVSDLWRTNSFFLTFVILALVFVLMQVVLGLSWNIHSVGVPLLWGMACLAVGAAVGFLFGIPKIAHRGNNGDHNAKAADSNIDSISEVNSNLMEISDWLTKIIVGLGLINLKQLPRYLKMVSQPLADCLPCSCSMAFALGIVVCFTVVGFLFGYLYTRLFIALMLDAADRTLAGQLRKKLKENKELTQTNKRKEVESKAKDAELGSLKTDVEFYKDISVGGAMVATAKKESSGATPVALEDRIKSAIEDGLEAHKIEDEKERSKMKTEAANKIALMVYNHELSKDDLVLRAPKAALTLKHSQDPLIAGLAVGINVFPEPEDLERLTRVAALADWPNTRYKIADALGRLFSVACAGKNDVQKAQRILATLMVQVSDAPLKRRLEETAALITRCTGVPVKGA